MNMNFEPVWFSRPGDTLLYFMKQKGMSYKDVSRSSGISLDILYGIIAGNYSIDKYIAERLSSFIGGSVDFWLNRQRIFSENLDRAARISDSDLARDWLRRIPNRHMEQMGWKFNSRDFLSKMKAALLFFNVCSVQEWSEAYEEQMNVVSFKKTSAFSDDCVATSIWLRQGEIEADKIECAAWNVDKFREALSVIRSLTRTKNIDYFMPRLRKICAECGVAVVFVKAPDGCRASGAAEFITNNKALIILSFRYLTDDHFWFSFFHEAGHLLLHSKDGTFLEGYGDLNIEKENEANRFAGSLLIPAAHWEKFTQIRCKTDDIVRFATSIGISTGIVVGQMQKNGIINYSQFNKLKRKFTWDEVKRTENSII